MSSLGRELHAAKRHAEATAWFERALAAAPDDFELLLDFGNLRCELGELGPAQALYRRAVAVDERSAIARSNLGYVLFQEGRLDEAEVVLRAATALAPELALAHHNLAAVHARRQQWPAATEAGARGVALDPRNLGARDALATAHVREGRISAAIAVQRGSLELFPEAPGPRNELGLLLYVVGEIDQAIALFESAIQLNPGDHATHSNLLLVLNYRRRDDVLARHRDWAARHSLPRAEVRRYQHEKLRVGFVSPDLNNHSVARFLLPFVRHHDRARFELYLYAASDQKDHVTTALRQLAGHWREVARDGPAALAQKIRDDEIDLLFDLSGHTGHNRLPLFTARAAPVQLTYLGYPNTTGIDAIDFRLTDAVADPPGADADYSERLLRLPGCFLCYEPLPGCPEVSPLPALAAGRVTFGSFNNLAKLSDETVSLWSRVLLAVPGSRLLLKASPLGDPEIRQRFTARFAEHGIGAERLVLHAHIGRQLEHLALYAQVDVALDPFPYNGTATTFEALWMGVPFVTLAGDRHAGRVGASILTALGLPVAESEDEYVEQARRAAADLPALGALRASLRARLHERGLTDGPRYARKLEDALLALR